MAEGSGEKIVKRDQFTDDPYGWARRWAVELSAAKDAYKPWWDRGDKVIDRYVDERKSSSGDSASRKRLNLFHGDVETKRALLYGNPPRVRCRRRHADAEDDVARVSSEMLERILNTDIDKDGDGFVESLGLARDDRLLPGLGIVRARYTVEMEDVPEVPAQVDDETGIELAPAVPATQRKTEEDAETGHIHWRDFLWSPCRKWEECRWVAFKAEMSRDELHERFDGVEWMADRVKDIPLESRHQDEKDKGDDPWARAHVWECWDRDSRKVYWVVEGFDSCLDIKDDPLGLDGFFPCPRPLMANTTTRKLIPVPDFAIAQDLYDEIDDLYDRIYMLTKSLRAVGAYDQQNAPTLASMLNGGENEMIPVANWNAFQERGGLNGAVQFFPVENIAKVIVALTEKLKEKIILKDQVTGIADVMRGAATAAATATEQRIKARFGSTRIQAAQDEFARFTTDTQKIRAEIIARHFDAQTIIDRSNVMRTPDAPFAQQAAELIKSGASEYRIEVASDALAMTDFDALKGDRVEFLQSIAAFLQQMGPVAMSMGPQALPFLLELLKHGVAGFRGAAQLEGVMDKMISAAQQAAQQAQQAAMQPKPPDPKVQAAQLDLKGKQMEIGAKAQQAKVDMAKTGMDFQIAKAEHQMDMREMAAQERVEMARAARAEEGDIGPRNGR